MDTAGLSVLDLLWLKLDDVVDALDEGEPVEYRETQAGKKALDVVRQWGELRGQAQGLAQAIAVLLNPYAPDVDAVRDQAMDRFDTRQRGTLRLTRAQRVIERRRRNQGK